MKLHKKRSLRAIVILKKKYENEKRKRDEKKNNRVISMDAGDEKIRGRRGTFECVFVYKGGSILSALQGKKN